MLKLHHNHYYNIKLNILKNFNFILKMDYFNIIKGELKKGVGQLKDRLTKTELQRKLKEATSNEHCHANISLLNEISQRTET